MLNNNLHKHILNLYKNGHEHICLNAKDYWYMARNHLNYMDCYFTLECLKCGRYAKYLDMEIWVDNGMPESYVKLVANGEPKYSTDGSWTASIPVEYSGNVEQALSMKAFW